jgi:hemerythrin
LIGWVNDQNPTKEAEMKDLVWRKEFEVGHEEVDAHHKIFFKIIVKIKKDHDFGCSKEKLACDVLELIKYADFHFFSELNTMMDNYYPDVIAHDNEHKKIINLLHGHVKKIEEGEGDLNALTSFLYSWFSKHTIHEDSQFIKYLNTISNPDKDDLPSRALLQAPTATL